MWPGVPLVESDCRILRLSIYLKSIKSYLSFLHGFIYQGRATLKTTLLGWVWPVFSLVKSDCRTLWSWISLKELIVVLDFLHWDNHEWKIVSETATFSWVLPVVPLVQTDCMILLLPLFLEEIQRKVSIWDYLCWWCVASCTFCPILLQDFLIINVSKKNQMISQFFLHGFNYQEKAASNTTLFGWVRPFLPLVQSYCRILWSSISLEGIYWCLRFFAGR